MHKTGKLQRFALAGLVLSSMLASGCAAKKTDKGEIAVICKAQNVQFWEAVQAGAEDCGEELQYKISYEAPENETQLAEQIKIMEAAIDRGVRAIVISPNDTDGLNAVIDKAIAKNIPVITVDSDVSHTGRISCVGSQNTDAGAIAARAVKELLPDGGKIAVMGHVEEAQTAIERVGGFEAEFAEDQKYSIVMTRYCDNEAETAKSQTIAMLKNEPEIKVIYATNEPSTTGVCDAITELGLSGKVKVIGFDSSDQEVSYIEDGTLDGIIVQNPYNMGYLGVRCADHYLNGETVRPELTTSVTLVTEENIHNEDIRFLINPVAE